MTLTIDLRDLDPGETDFYLVPVTANGRTLARPRLVDDSLRDLYRELVLARPCPPESWTVLRCPSSVQVLFESYWENRVCRQPGQGIDALLPGGGLARSTSALALWQADLPFAGTTAEPSADLAALAHSLSSALTALLHDAPTAVLLSGPKGADPLLMELGRSPSIWREAAATVLLADDWDPAETTDDSVAHFVRRLDKEMGNWRPAWERQLGYRPVAVLSEPVAMEGERALTLADCVADRTDVERTVLDRLAVTGDSCVLQVMAQLPERETRIADIYARTTLSWAQAAELAGEPAQAGNTVSKKLLRLGREHAKRAKEAWLGYGKHPEKGCPHSWPVPSRGHMGMAAAPRS